MKNGITKYPTKKQLEILKKEYDNTRVKKDLEQKYKTTIVNINNVLKNGRCSEKVYEIIFSKN